MQTEPARLLIVEDDVQLAELLLEYLGQQGFELSRLSSGTPASAAILETKPDVLSMLAKDAGTVIGREDLYKQVIGVEYDGIDRGMDVHVSRIRRKLEHAGFDSTRLKSVRGVGYLLATR